MLENFRFARYRFTYAVEEPLRLPPYKGNTFGSRFGYILRDIACIGDADECDTRCLFPDKCIYSKCFEPPVPEDSLLLQDEPFVPHPFVVEPPRTGKLEYVPGDVLVCHLILIGEAINLLPWMVFTFNEVGKRRIGLRGERGRCLLDKVESLSTGVNAGHETVYTAETQMLRGKGLILGLDDVMGAAPRVARKIELEFRTPASIKVGGRWTSDLRFEHLMRDLLRRIRLLSSCYCGEDLDVDVSDLLEAADAVTHESHLRWFRSDLWSHGKEHSMPVGGFVGKIRFTGYLTPFLPYIFLGAYLHIGYHTAFGYGQYRVRSMTG